MDLTKKASEHLKQAWKPKEYQVLTPATVATAPPGARQLLLGARWPPPNTTIGLRCWDLHQGLLPSASHSRAISCSWHCYSTICFSLPQGRRRAEVLTTCQAAVLRAERTVTTVSAASPGPGSALPPPLLLVKPIWKWGAHKLGLSAAPAPQWHLWPGWGWEGKARCPPHAAAT